MSKKSNKKKSSPKVAVKKTRAEILAEEAKRVKRTRIILIVFAAVAAAALLTVATVGIVRAIMNNERADVMKDNLGKYIYISPDDYKSYTLSIKTDPVDDTAIESAFIQALYQQRTLDKTYDGLKYYVKDYVGSGMPRAIGIGDSVTIRYIGYTIDESGKRDYFNGGCNFSDEEGYTLNIGSGDFVNGFEVGLVGKMPSDYSLLTSSESGTVERGDVVVVTLTAMYSDGSATSEQSYTIIADSAEIDSTWGTGFADFLTGKSVGKLVDENGNALSFKTKDVSDKSAYSVYADITIEKIYKNGDNPLTVDAYFPLSYDEASLAGKWVKFDVYVESAQYYTVPAIDESYVTSKLGMTVDALRAYGAEGATLEDCYRGYLKKSLEETAESERESAVISAFWEYIFEKTKVKRLPKGDVNEYYNDYLADLSSYYESVKDNYSSFDEFAVTYLEVGKNSNWRDELYASAEKSVTEKLIFYYIIKNENFIPSDEEFDAMFDEKVDEMLGMVLEQMKLTEDSFDTKEEYEAELNELREALLDEKEGYGYDYFAEQVYYEYGMGKIVAMATVVGS